MLHFQGASRRASRRREPEHLQVLGRLMLAEEAERRRIARELHDQFGQRLTALRLQAGRLRAECGGSRRLREQVEGLAALADGLDQDIDCLVWELRPAALDDLGLKAALASHVRMWSTHTGIPADLQATRLGDRLPPQIETTLYRIAQEALTNVAKHARAERVEVALDRRGRQVSLVIADDGVGFDPGKTDVAGRGLGLLGMEERAALVGGSVRIKATAGRGTTVTVRVPAPAALPERS